MVAAGGGAVLDVLDHEAVTLGQDALPLKNGRVPLQGLDLLQGGVLPLEYHPVLPVGRAPQHQAAGQAADLELFAVYTHTLAPLRFRWKNKIPALSCLTKRGRVPIMILEKGAVTAASPFFQSDSINYADRLGTSQAVSTLLWS